MQNLFRRLHRLRFGLCLLFLAAVGFVVLTCGGLVQLNWHIKGSSRTTISEFTFSNKYLIEDMVLAADDASYLSERFRVAQRFDSASDHGRTFECFIDFAPIGRARCRVSPCMKRDAFTLKLFTSVFALDEEWFTIALTDPMPDGIRNLLKVLREASLRSAKAT